jgi:predicted porin
MKKSIFAVVAFAICGTAWAQSSVTLYGLLDAGITYTNHEDSSSGKGAAIQFQSAVAQSNRWGLRGVEDLGGGLKAIGYYFPAYAIGANTPAGLLAWSLPADAPGGYTLDNRIWGDLVNNAVKYESPVIGGFTFGAMYGFGNVAGSMGANSSSNFYVSYAHGPFSAAISYLSLHDVTSTANSVEYAGGAAYNIGKARLFGYITDVQLSSGTKPRATTFEAGATYQLTTQFSLGGGLQYQSRNNNVGSANQLTLSADYALSKSTDAYLVGALAHDHGYGAQAEAAWGVSSDTDEQTAVRIGIRHKF